MSLGQTDRSSVSKYADQGPSGLGEQEDAQRFGNQGFWLMGTKTIATKEEMNIDHKS